MAMEMTPASSPFCVRDAAAGDLPRLLALEAMFSGDRLSPRQFRHHLASPRARLRVVERGGSVCAYALVLLRHGSRIARLYSIAVDPALRGAGLGAALLDDALQQARAAGRARLRLEVRQDNVAAIALYRRAGFVPFGQISGYYEDGCAALRMERAVGDEDE